MEGMPKPQKQEAPAAEQPTPQPEQAEALAVPNAEREKTASIEGRRGIMVAIPGSDGNLKQGPNFETIMTEVINPQIDLDEYGAPTLKFEVPGDPTKRTARFSGGRWIATEQPATQASIEGRRVIKVAIPGRNGVFEQDSTTYETIMTEVSNPEISFDENGAPKLEFEVPGNPARRTARFANGRWEAVD